MGRFDEGYDLSSDDDKPSVSIGAIAGKSSILSSLYSAQNKAQQKKAPATPAKPVIRGGAGASILQKAQSRLKGESPAPSAQTPAKPGLTRQVSFSKAPIRIESAAGGASDEDDGSEDGSDDEIAAYLKSLRARSSDAAREERVTAGNVDVESDSDGIDSDAINEGDWKAAVSSGFLKKGAEAPSPKSALKSALKSARDSDDSDVSEPLSSPSRKPSAPRPVVTLDSDDEEMRKYVAGLSDSDSDDGAAVRSKVSTAADVTKKSAAPPATSGSGTSKGSVPASKRPVESESDEDEESRRRKAAAAAFLANRSSSVSSGIGKASSRAAKYDSDPESVGDGSDLVDANSLIGRKKAPSSSSSSSRSSSRSRSRSRSRSPASSSRSSSPRGRSRRRRSRSRSRSRSTSRSRSRSSSRSRSTSPSRSRSRSPPSKTPERRGSLSLRPMSSATVHSDDDKEDADEHFSESVAEDDDQRSDGAGGGEKGIFLRVPALGVGGKATDSNKLSVPASPGRPDEPSYRDDFTGDGESTEDKSDRTLSADELSHASDGQQHVQNAPAATAPPATSASQVPAKTKDADVPSAPACAPDKPDAVGGDGKGEGDKGERWAHLRERKSGRRRHRHRSESASTDLGTEESESVTASDTTDDSYARRRSSRSHHRRSRSHRHHRPASAYWGPPPPPPHYYGAFPPYPYPPPYGYPPPMVPPVSVPFGYGAPFAFPGMGFVPFATPSPATATATAAPAPAAATHNETASQTVQPGVDAQGSASGARTTAPPTVPPQMQTHTVYVPVYQPAPPTQQPYAVGGAFGAPLPAQAQSLSSQQAPAQPTPSPFPSVPPYSHRRSAPTEESHPTGASAANVGYLSRMLRHHFELMRAYVETQQDLLRAKMEHRQDLAPTTLAGTLDYIARHRKKPLTMEEALRQVRENEL